MMNEAMALGMWLWESTVLKSPPECLRTIQLKVWGLSQREQVCLNPQLIWFTHATYEGLCCYCNCSLKPQTVFRSGNEGQLDILGNMHSFSVQELGEKVMNALHKKLVPGDA